jgi:hypothetical protein
MWICTGKLMPNNVHKYAATYKGRSKRNTRRWQCPDKGGEVAHKEAYNKNPARFCVIFSGVVRA